nr:MAG TPA: hypothetical protein [Caudoviricetes sp.]
MPDLSGFTTARPKEVSLLYFHGCAVFLFHARR